MTARALKAENAKVQVGTTMATLALGLRTETVMDEISGLDHFPAQEESEHSTSSSTAKSSKFRIL